MQVEVTRALRPLGRFGDAGTSTSVKHNYYWYQAANAQHFDNRASVHIASE